MDSRWTPSISLANLRQRAAIMRSIRTYFLQEAVLEVETPLLSHHGSTDVHLAQWQLPSGHWLQTSPEFAMKRLLAAGSGDIFQLCRALRREESSERHSPEFTMLEWYRVGMDEFQLMDDVAALLRFICPQRTFETATYSYRDIFLKHGLPDPLCSPLIAMRRAACEHLHADTERWCYNDCLDGLLASVIEPSLPTEKLVFIYNFPATQAALASYGEQNGHRIARRFELYWAGLELANGYFELTDPVEQENRFAADLAYRRAQGLPVPTYDANLLAALKYGLPTCSGVALGVDRLLMILLQARKIADVMAFDFERC